MDGRTQGWIHGYLYNEMNGKHNMKSSSLDGYKVGQMDKNGQKNVDKDDSIEVIC